MTNHRSIHSPIHPDGSRTRHRAWVARWCAASCGLIAIIALAGCDIALPVLPVDESRLSAVMPSRQFTDDTAATAEFDLIASPNNIQLRVDLLWFYRGQFGNAQAERDANKHVLWLIEHQPRAAVLATPVAEIPTLPHRESFDQAALLWTRQVEEHEKDAKVLGHAGIFVVNHDPVQAAGRLERAAALEPDSPTWPQFLAQAYHTLAQSPDAKAADRYGQRAIEQYKIAIERSKSVRMDRYLLQRMAQIAVKVGELDVAITAADDLVTQATQMLDAGERAVVLHTASVTRGRVASIRGNTELAVEHLKHAATALGSATGLSLSELDMSLARDLTGKKRTLDVLVYLVALHRATEADVVTQWIGSIKQDQSPDFSLYVH